MMSSSRRLLLSAVCLVLGTGIAAAGEPEHKSGYFGYGAAPTPQQVAGWAIAVRPDGQGLPPGRGTVADGAEAYTQACAACHGTFGEGAERYPRLAGEAKLTGDRPDPTVGAYWPYATTLFDYINRAMPFTAPRSLTPDQVYAITAYVLNLNNVVGEDFVADKVSLPTVKMPNRDGFIWTDPRPDTKDTACMKDCSKPDEVKVLSTAEGKNLTPRTTGPLDTAMPQ